MSPNALLCFHCMNPIPEAGAICLHCGHNNHTRDNGPGMLPEMVLNDQYQVGRVLGRGGFGVTYIGYDLSMERKVAIKEYFPTHLVMRESNNCSLSTLTGSEEDYQKGLRRAIKESRMATTLGQVEHVVHIYNVFSANNTIYLIMEYVEGETLTQYVESHLKHLSLPEAIRLLSPVAKALQTLHSKRVIHRDVKPDNIMIEKNSQQGVLLDFGAARITDETTLSSSAAVVSAGYAPPEQYNLSSMDGRIDQYALGATMVYTLTGKRPPDVIERIAQGSAMPSLRALNSSLSAAAENAIYKAMAMKAQDRYPTVSAFWDALTRCAEGKGARFSLKKAVALALSITLAGGVLAYFGPRTQLWQQVFGQKSQPAGLSTVSLLTPSPEVLPDLTPLPSEAAPTETPQPTEDPTPELTQAPTLEPTATPTAEPTAVPTPMANAATQLPACVVQLGTEGVDIKIPQDLYPSIEKIHLFRLHSRTRTLLCSIDRDGTNHYTDTDVENGENYSYFYQIVFTDGSTTSDSELASIVWTKQQTTAVPTPTERQRPEGISYSYTDDNRGVIITIPKDPNGILVCCSLYRKNKDDVDVCIKSFESEPLVYTDTSVKPGEIYTYYYTIGYSNIIMPPTSVPVSVTIPNEPIVTPTPMPKPVPTKSKSAQDYQEALAQLKEGNYEAAMEGFAALGNYDDSIDQYNRSVAGRAVQLLMQSDLEGAAQLVYDNRDTIHPENYPMLDTAEGISIYYFRAERYDGSIVDEIQFMEMPSTKRIVSANYDEEGQLICYCQFNEGSFGWEQLVGSFVWEEFAEKLDLRTGRAEATSANEESAKKEQEPAQVYEEALAQLNDGDYEAAMTGFASLGDYKDSEQQYVRSVAGRAVQLLMQSDLESATQLLFDNRDFIHPENYPMLDTAEGISIYYFVSQNYDGSQHDEIQFMEMPSEKRIICAKFDTDGKRIGYARFDEASFSWNPYGKRFVWEEFVEKLGLKATAREGQPAGKPKAADQESRDLFNELFHEASWHPGWMGDDRIPSMGYNARGEQVTWVLDFIYQSSKGKRISDVSVSWGELEGEYAEAWEDAKAGKTYYFLSSYMDGRLTYSLLMPDDPSIAGWQTFAFTLDGYRVEYALELVYKGDYETGRGWGANDAYLVSITPV